MASNSTVCAHNVSTNTLNVATGLKKPVLSVNAATTLTADQSGSFVVLGVVGTEQAASTGFNVDLPPPERGLEYTIMLAAPSIANNSNAAITVTSNSLGSTAADLIVGILVCGSANDASVVAVADTITFVHNKSTAGDHVHLVSDGTNWFARIFYDVDDAVTLG